MKAALARRVETRPTGIVLWLMILVVFVPIAGMHGLARLLDTGTEPVGTRQQATMPVAAPRPGAS